MSKWILRVKPLVRAALTLVAVGAAAWFVAGLWQVYVLAPWTRDGRVGAQIVRMAPEVSGSVIAVAVSDDQYVRRGDVLYRIDDAGFALALAQAQAQLTGATAALRQKTSEARRRQGLERVLSAEEIQRANHAVAMAQADQRQAQVAVDQATLALTRTVVRAPVDGYVTRLRLSPGDYAATGQPNLALVDANSFGMTGYFEETKVKGIQPGAAARIRLMGSDEIITGQVMSIGRGIADTNQQADDQGLPSVAPTFSWIRLAQRIPVRVAFTALPPGTVLAAGMTGSIEVVTAEGEATPQGWLVSVLQRWM